MSYKPAKFERLELHVWENDKGFHVADNDRIVFLFDDNILHVGMGDAGWNANCNTLKEAQTRLNKYNNTRV